MKTWKIRAILTTPRV